MKTMDIDQLKEKEGTSKPGQKDVVPGQNSAPPSRMAMVCLGLLCVLLLARIIALFLYHRNILNSYNILIQERDQLKINTEKIKEALSCPKGWEKKYHRCYYISSVKKNWKQSLKDCNNKGANLVIIKTKKTQSYINQKLGTGKNTWIGLSDSEGTWTWVDNTTLTTDRFWDTGQPNSHKGQDEDCVEFVHSNSSQGMWKVNQCHKKNRWICEKKRLS